MQKVRSPPKSIIFLLELLIKLLFQLISLSVLFTIAYISYLALEEGSPYIQTGLYPFYFLCNISVDYLLHIVYIIRNT
jgi:hypothetical protein